MLISNNRRLRAFLLACVYLLGALGIMATGGGSGGGSSDDDFEITSVQIELVSAATYDDEIELRANITFNAGDDVDYPYFAPITWHNSLTGASIHHSAKYFIKCTFNLSFEETCIVRGPQWITENVPLEIGQNRISISIESDAGTVTDSVMIEKFDIGLPPNPPSGVSVAPVDTGVVVSWNPVALATSYNIYYAAAPGVTKASYTSLPNGNTSTVANSPVTISGFVPGNEYYFVVTSDNSIFESDESIEVSLEIGPTINLGIKTFEFAWPDLAGRTHYRLLENPDGLSGYSQVGSDISQGTEFYEHIVPLYERMNARYILQECQGAVCNFYHEFNISGNLVDAVGYFKASNPGALDSFGGSVSLSSDGRTLAVAAGDEDSGNGGINATPNELAEDSGAVYVFSREAGPWVQQAYIKAPNPTAKDYFGGEASFHVPDDTTESISLSDDGSTLAVGANWDDTFGFNQGSVYVFVRNGSFWTQQAHIPPGNLTSPNSFGRAVSLSSDGNVLAVGAPRREAAYVFNRVGDTWTEAAYLNPSNPAAGFGDYLSLSGDGETLAVGAPGEASSTTGINSIPDDLLSGAGAVYVFTETSEIWTEQAYIKPSHTSTTELTGDNFGHSVSLSGDGNTLAVGAPKEDSSATGINPTPDDLEYDTGAIFVFKRAGATWIEHAFLKPAHSSYSRFFGFSVSLSGDGNTLASGEYGDGFGQLGVNPPLLNSSDGSVSVFNQSGGSWAQTASIKATRPYVDFFGKAVSLSDDGNTLAVGAPGEDGASSGVSGNQDDSSLVSSGAVYLY